MTAPAPATPPNASRPLRVPVLLEYAITDWIRKGPDRSGRDSPTGRAQEVIALVNRVRGALADGDRAHLFANLARTEADR